jgi:hypothetical protein
MERVSRQKPTTAPTRPMTGRTHMGTARCGGRWVGVAGSVQLAVLLEVVVFMRPDQSQLNHVISRSELLSTSKS